MTTSPIVDLQDVSLCYRLAKHQAPSFKEYLIHAVKANLRYEQLWALRDVSLRVDEGEVVGVVGRNGAGKSTLAKVISGVIKPNKGRRRVQGSIAPILELSCGFDWELTGLENIYLNGLFLGHSRKEIDERLDSIVEFSGISDFIGSPMRNYSSGMVARLGFSVVTAWKPDLLILDEVLAVGDASFLARCEERMQLFRDQGTTILLISHDLEGLAEMCSRCIWLDGGVKCADGQPDEVIGAYSEAAMQRIQAAGVGTAEVGTAASVAAAGEATVADEPVEPAAAVAEMVGEPSATR